MEIDVVQYARAHAQNSIDILRLSMKIDYNKLTL